jgi:hypothetical protein
MKAFHALFQVPAFLRRFVDDTSELFDAGCWHEIGIADAEVTKIGSVAIKAIQHCSRQSDLFFNLNRREMRKIGVVNCVGAGRRMSADDRAKPNGRQRNVTPRGTATEIPR